MFSLALTDVVFGELFLKPIDARMFEYAPAIADVCWLVP